MSIAGIRSNRGDSYQTLVAFDLALFVLSDPDYQWIEIDSVTLSVDDIVIGKTDGTKICCQCKKNQPDFTAWTIADLGDELDKATSLLANDPQVEVRFYSRSSFGSIAKLREHCTTQADGVSFLASLGLEHQRTADQLAKKLARTPALSIYEFLCRVTFETSPELDRMEALLRERLRFMASSQHIAYNALWTRLDQLGARIDGNGISASTQHRLTKEDLKGILHQAGAMLAPKMALAEVRASFVSTSTIGRSWHRDIAGHRIPSPVMHELLAAIEDKKHAILVTGLPGSGKTCLMLAVQDALEQRAQIRSDLAPIFIQSREFADLASAQDRHAQGLPEHWVEKVARMAEEAHTVIVIDSLDVLSIAREHSVLTYFLAQIDRLLLIPNVTVVTACRDFDRHYDRRIAERQWDYEITCPALDWDAIITPLLQELDIDTQSIDAVTRELIQNPRELALFVELAKRGGSFNVVTSQALAERYLNNVVRADEALGNAAIQAIEAIAVEMLKSRSLALPHQRFTATQEILRALLSHNVLHETQDGQLTFGHQTLLDVLVISGAMRQSVTLIEFIESLPPVPFVRPSIRSFVMHLASGERRNFRKQLRTVLLGNTAFHIRRLVAESFSKQKPNDDDWPLIRDLRTQHREVFQVIYTQATLVEWHHFWLKYLVPALKDARDADGLTMHAHRISQWKNDDATGVLAFWTEALTLDWVDGSKFTSQLGMYLSEIDTKDFMSVSPLLKRLLSMPRQEHGFLGRAVARGVKTGHVDDALLWNYVAGEISDSDVLEFQLGDKLRCAAHEFGHSSDNFFLERMVQSPALLDLAVKSIEAWSLSRISERGPWMAGYSGFLGHTSYNDVHNDQDIRHVDSEGTLLGAMEAAIIQHAQTNSSWWQANRQRLSFDHESALRYFAILACTKSPIANIDVIGCLLRNETLLESDLSYELGTLIQAAFIYLKPFTQDAVLAAILALQEERITDERSRLWVLKKRAEIIITIPCHLRSQEAQEVLDTYEKAEGILFRQPSINSRGGCVRAPFSFEIFTGANDDGVLRLLTHYTGYSDRHGGDFLTGGEREVGGQLREAASRQPSRFLNLLAVRWDDISDCFRDDIIEGVANYLAYSYGNLKPNGAWAPLDEPDAPTLAHHILDELEQHPTHWHHNRAASGALQACAYVTQDTLEAARLVLSVTDFADLIEESSISGGQGDLVTTGINMIRGHVAEALMILASQLQEKNVKLPESLPLALCHFAKDDVPAIRALILRRLPYLQSQSPELGWKLYNLAIEGDAAGLWKHAERCLYYVYYNHFEKVAPSLARLYTDGAGKDLETWGRISALAALSKRIVFGDVLVDLIALNSTDAWRGAAAVWTHPENINQHREQCFSGIDAGLNSLNAHAVVVAQQMKSIFRIIKPPISVPTELIRRCFSVFENDIENKSREIFGFDEWLNTTCHRDPEQALAATEIYLAYVNQTKPYLYDHEKNLTQLLTRLFGEAEEREDSDQGLMLQRVVAVQDALLSLGVNGLDDWLKAAERP